MSSVLITGSAGFIGYHVSLALLKRGYSVVGYDNLNDYYSIELKKARVNQLKAYDNFIFCVADICNKYMLEKTVERYHVDRIIHLAAQAGVRYSLICPETYIESNIVGTFQILEICRKYHITKLMYASSSSVYGDSDERQLSLDLRTDMPISLYAATKKCDELLVYTYCNNYKLNAIGMRFFTVYGPFGRPDMAYYSFADRIINGESIEIYNFGKQYRDFTYIDDLIEGVLGILDYQDKIKDDAGDYRIYNIGNGRPVALMDFIETLEEIIGKKTEKIFCEKRTGDVERTFADISELQKICHYNPQTSLRDGLSAFYDWYKQYYSI